MVNLRFSDQDIFDCVGRTNAIQFLFWLDFDDYSNKDILFNYLLNCRVESCVSPLHDKDMNLGEPKKPHYHVMMTFGSGKNKSVRQWFTLIDPIRDFISVAPFDKGTSSLSDCGKVWFEENSIQTMRGALRYFKHLDNPEKADYSNLDYICFGGFDVENVVLNDTDAKKILLQIRSWIKENQCYSYADLVDYCAVYNREWFNIVTRNNYINVIDKYQKSMLYRDSGALEKKIEKFYNQANSED